MEQDRTFSPYTHQSDRTVADAIVTSHYIPDALYLICRLSRLTELTAPCPYELSILPHACRQLHTVWRRAWRQKRAMPTRPPKPWVPRTDGVGRRARPQLEVQKVDINGLEEKVKTLRRQQSTYQDHLSCVSRCEAPASVHRSACARPTTVRVQPAPYSRGAPSCMHALLAASALRRQRGVCEKSPGESNTFEPHRCLCP